MTRRLVFFLAGCLAINLALAWLPAPWNETALTHTGMFVRGEAGEDSWAPMLVGVQHVDAGRPGRIYDAIFFEQRIKLQYPPAALLPIDVVQRVSWALRRPPRDVLNAISWAMVLATAALAAWVLAAGLPRQDRSGAVPLAVVSAATFYPLLKGYSLGQIQTWIDALAALLLVAWLKQWKTTAGMTLALIALIKPQFSLLLLWGLVRRERRFAAAFAATALAALAVSTARFGLAAHVNYLDVLGFLIRHGEAHFANQSVSGVLNRALGNGSNLVWQCDTFPPYHPWVFAATVLSALALAAAGLCARSAERGRAGAADLGAMMVVATLASPIAWEHHYGVLLPLYAFLFPRVAPLGRWALPALGVSYVLVSNYFALARMLAFTPAGVLQSYTFFGGLLALLLLLALRRRGAAANEPSGVLEAAQ